MPDLLVLFEREIEAQTIKYGTYTIEQNSPHKLNVKSGSTTVCDAQRPQGKKWTVQVVVNIIEVDA